MTPEEKEPLLKDLCARLPYSTIVNVYNGKYREDVKLEPYIVADIDEWQPKPYLRPMSSMTEEEKDKMYCSFMEKDASGFPSDSINKNKVNEYMSWVLSHHFDINHLIERGLALEAPEGMYNN